MRRAVHIVGSSALAAAGLVLAVATRYWWAVWLVGFPIMYAGVNGLYRHIRTAVRSSGQTAESE